MALEAFHDDDQPKVEKKESVKKNKEQKTEKKEQVSSNETPIDQQKFINNKFIRLDDLFLRREKSKVTFNEKEPTAWWKLVTKRDNISFNIEKNSWAWVNAEIIIKDNKDTYKIYMVLLESFGKYEMSVLKNWVAQNKANANAAATKYIGML